MHITNVMSVILFIFKYSINLVSLLSTDFILQTN